MLPEAGGRLSRGEGGGGEGGAGAARGAEGPSAPPRIQLIGVAFARGGGVAQGHHEVIAEGQVLPLHRHAETYARADVERSRATLADMGGQTARRGRPLVDALVLAMIGQGADALDPPLKRRFARLIAFDLRIGGETSPVSVAAARLAQSLARSFESGASELALFDPPTAFEWAALARPLESWDGDE